MGLSPAQTRRPGRRLRIGTGGPPVVLEESHFVWHDLEVRTSTQNISQSTDWRVREPRHVIIVHLAGRMDELETELAGHGGSSGPATRGEVWTVPADTSYASHAKGGIIRFAVLSIPPESERRETRGDKDFRMIKPTAGARNEELSRTIEQLVKTAAGIDDVSRMQAETFADAITRNVFQAYGTVGYSESSGKCQSLILASHEARLLREFIFDNLGSPLSLDTLATHKGMTTHQLLAAFRAAFGTTPAQYIINQRLRRAQWYLLHSQLDITSIALETGFSSHSHLTSTFTSRLGYSPVAFREKFTS